MLATQIVPTPPSDPISPSALAVGMRRKVVKNSGACVPRSSGPHGQRSDDLVCERATFYFYLQVRPAEGPLTAVRRELLTGRTPWGHALGFAALGFAALGFAPIDASRHDRRASLVEEKKCPRAPSCANES